MKFNPLRKRQAIGTILGIILVVIGMVALNVPQTETYSMIGPLNTGHESLTCAECHTPAKGNLGQQFQTNFLEFIGARKNGTTFGLENVDNKKCLACHTRPNDRHPVHRFEEPKYSEARKNIHPTECKSCHLEHNGVRITIDNIGFCQNCHQDTELKHDPLDVSHKDLIANDQWNTCIQCHDFHGNHIYDVATKMEDTISIQAILDYVKGSKSPFSDKKKYTPKTTILED